MNDTRCINIIEMWPDEPEPQAGYSCEFCDQVECDCPPGEGVNFRDTDFCGRPGYPIETNDGTKYVCEDCPPFVLEEGMLNGFELRQDQQSAEDDAAIESLKGKLL
jgi:hypothetical protein